METGKKKEEDCSTVYQHVQKAISAYKMPRDVIEYHVVTAMLGLPCLVELTTFTDNLKEIFNYFEDFLKLFMKSNEGRRSCLDAVRVNNIACLIDLIIT